MTRRESLSRRREYTPVPCSAPSGTPDRHGWASPNRFQLLTTHGQQRPALLDWLGSHPCGCLRPAREAGHGHRSTVARYARTISSVPCLAPIIHVTWFLLPARASASTTSPR